LGGTLGQINNPRSCQFGFCQRSQRTCGTGRGARTGDCEEGVPFALHDLSRVELDRTPPCTPRFNMPFELGLSVAWDKFGSRPHGWFVFEAKGFRLAKSLSDLSGTDIYLHNGRIDGVFRELCNAFVRRDQQPSVQQM
jgi:hypothetical protein